MGMIHLDVQTSIYPILHLFYRFDCRDYPLRRKAIKEQSPGLSG